MTRYILKPSSLAEHDNMKRMLSYAQNKKNRSDNDLRVYFKQEKFSDELQLLAAVMLNRPALFRNIRDNCVCYKEQKDLAESGPIEDNFGEFLLLAEMHSDQALLKELTNHSYWRRGQGLVPETVMTIALSWGLQYMRGPIECQIIGSTLALAFLARMILSSESDDKINHQEHIKAAKQNAIKNYPELFESEKINVPQASESKMQALIEELAAISNKAKTEFQTKLEDKLKELQDKLKQAVVALDRKGMNDCLQQLSDKSCLAKLRLSLISQEKIDDYSNYNHHQSQPYRYESNSRFFNRNDLIERGLLTITTEPRMITCGILSFLLKKIENSYNDKTTNKNSALMLEELVSSLSDSDLKWMVKQDNQPLNKLLAAHEVTGDLPHGLISRLRKAVEKDSLDDPNASWFSPHL